MLHYFYVLHHDFFERFRHDLGAARRARDFTPCAALCQELVAARSLPEDAIVAAVARGISFDPHVWHGLVGECLIFGCAELPRLETAPRSLLAILAPQRLDTENEPRSTATEIEQAHYGARDLRLGGYYYRPEQVGWNDRGDVARLSNYLRAVDPDAWQVQELAGLAEFPDDAERAEELAFLRDWWPALVELYGRAESTGQVVVCERT